MRNPEAIYDELRAALDAAGDAPKDKVLAVRAPARSEIAGNHTDHEGGRVIAGALNRSIDCLAVDNGTNTIRVMSEGFAPVEVMLDGLEPREDEKVTSAALVRGMAAQMADTGRTPQGFDLVMRSDIPSGGGLSSSAAYELAMCRAMEALWPGRAVDEVEAAQMAQRVENDWFGKPCGLMDQLAVSLGGLAFMDFKDPDEPQTKKLAFDFTAAGYALCLTDVGCDHTAYTDEYAAVPQEMKAVAQAFGKERLCEVAESEFAARIPELRRALGDRAVLRGLHYYNECRLVDERWAALGDDHIEDFLRLTNRSGASSAMFLQNVSAGTKHQDAMIAIALSESLLLGRGATRIHGGGFGGSIQSFVPLDLLDKFVACMDGWLGEGSCKVYAISDEGAEAAWL